MGIGIALCIIGPAFMILLGGIFSPDSPTAAGFIRDFSRLHGLLTLFPRIDHGETAGSMNLRY